MYNWVGIDYGVLYMASRGGGRTTGGAAKQTAQTTYRVPPHKKFLFHVYLCNIMYKWLYIRNRLEGRPGAKPTKEKGPPKKSKRMAVFGSSSFGLANLT